MESLDNTRRSSSSQLPQPDTRPDSIGGSNESIKSSSKSSEPEHLPGNPSSPENPQENPRQQWGHQSFKLLITGASGTGKTSYLRKFILGSDYDYIFIFDHEDELGRKLGWGLSHTADDLKNDLKTGVVVFDPAEMFGGEFDQAFAFFSDWVFSVSEVLKGRKLFVVDEIQKFLDVYSIPAEFKDLLMTGRRRGIDIAIISQQPNLLHNMLRNQFTEVVTFQHIDKAPIQWHRDLGFSEDEIRRLGHLQFICKDMKRGTMFTGRLS